MARDKVTGRFPLSFLDILVLKRLRFNDEKTSTHPNVQ